MSGSTYGRLFRITTAGESHGPGYVVIVDGVPAGIPLSEADLQAEAANMGVQVRDLIDWTDAEFDRHQSFVEQFLATRLECVAALLDGDPCDPLACTTDSDTCDPAAGM